MLHIYAALAEKERRMIGERTRAGLAAAKKRGVKLGGLNAKGIAERQAALERAEQLRPLFAELAGLSARKAAEELNRRSVPTPAGGKWHAATVLRVRKRLGSPTLRAAPCSRRAQFSGVTSITVARSRIHSSSVIGLSLMI
jgi:hypothetical protein